MSHLGHIGGSNPLADSHHQGHLQHLADLRQQADTARLVQEYRRGHPESQLRYRLAQALRTAADRLAPAASAPASRPRAIQRKATRAGVASLGR